jgi:signal peptidase II
MKIQPKAVFWYVVFLVILLDQTTKTWITETFFLGQSNTVIPGLFNLTYIHNEGTAFGMFQGNNYGMLVVVVLIMGFLVWFSRYLLWERVDVNVLAACILGGGIGNVIDRIHNKAVIDFLDFHIQGHHWPAFNVADAAVSCSVAWILIGTLLGRNFYRS